MSSILLVEDDPMQRLLIGQVLRMAGHTVWLANTGAEGVAIATSRYPDVILMDVFLPELNGLEATHQIKAHRATQHIPIIVLTTYMLIDALIAQTYGCDDFAIKPINFTALLAKIERLCRPTHATEFGAGA